MTDDPSLKTLLAWFASEVSDSIPVRLTSRETNEGGTPEWSGGLRHYLTGNPCATDKDGWVTSRLRCRLSGLYRHGGQDKHRAEFLYRLAASNGDWLTAVRSKNYSTSHWPEHECQAYAHASLRILWRLMQSEPVRYVPGPRIEKSESQHRAEEAA